MPGSSLLRNLIYNNKIGLRAKGSGAQTLLGLAPNADPHTRACLPSRPAGKLAGTAFIPGATMPDSQPPKLRWYQYSIRTLFIITTLFAIACSWYAYEMQKAAKRRAAIAEIEKLGGWVRYYDANRSKKLGEPPAWYSWLRKLHGDEYLGNVVVVSFVVANELTDDGLVHLKELTSVESVQLGFTPITDDGLVHLKGLVYLKELTLIDPTITDDGLVHLKGLKNLESLDLVCMQVTEEGVKKLQEALPNCEIFH